MNKAIRDSILDVIWPEHLRSDSQVFAILDGARDERIAYELDGTFCEHDCLYAGNLPLALQRAAPHLVQIDRDDRLTRFILENGWGSSWGVFARTSIGFKNLRKHLRTFLRVKDERGNRLIFRYYDPRVLRVYLPTCTTSEFTKVFGPVQSFFMENDHGLQIVEMRPGNRTLEAVVTPLSAAATRASHEPS
jgi:hypothetical protein